MKNKAIEIKQISATETLVIRHKAMWANKPIAFVKLPNDENGKHFGLFINDKIIAVISLFTENNEAQFRKFATLTEFQGFGYGTILLKHIITVLEKEGIQKVWCNARVEKSKFYEKFNLKTTDTIFEKEGIDYVIMEIIFSN